ncbi:MAG TPA: J domain-containing protein [Parafilimonas sp.]|nr:J domain-containing protein [Parafilimonas sp.]
MTNYYEILEIEDFASLETIKDAHRRLALQYHPDRNKGDKSCEEKFKVIQDAYEHLNTFEKKQTYDEQLTAVYAYEQAEPSYEFNSYPEPEPQRYNRRKRYSYRFSWIIILAFSSLVYHTISNNSQVPDDYSIIYQNNSNSTQPLLRAENDQSRTAPGSEMISQDGRVLFTIGSSKQEVFVAQGRPFHVEVVDVFNKEVWSYNRSTISFEDGFVTGYNNADSNLNVTVKRADASAKVLSYSVGSSTDDVLTIEGVPEAVTKIMGSNEEIWTYGSAYITVRNHLVESYSDNANVLHVKR